MNKKIILFYIFLLSILLSFFTYSETLSNPNICKLRVEAAIKLLQTESEEIAYDKIRDPKGEFRLGEHDNSYVWVHDLEGVMIMHPINPFLEGRNLINMRDQNGTYIFAEFNNICEEHGAGWLQYLWPLPGKTISIPKSSYVKMVKIGEKSIIVGSGIYNITAEELRKLFPDDIVVSN